MKRGHLFAVPALVLAMSAGFGFGQEDVDNRSDGGLNLTVTLEDASQPRAAARNIELPIDESTRPSPPASEEGRFQPADFARPNHLEALQIDADDLPSRSPAVAVRCQAFIGIDGSLGDYFCISDDNRAYRDVVTAVILAVPAQQFVAARVDGDNVRVLMNFAVYVDCSSGSCLAVAARNHGYHAEQLGLDYVDPQPILAGDDWYDGFDYKLRWARDWMPRITNVNRWDMDDRLAYVMAAEIDTNGSAAPGCLYWVGVGHSDTLSGTLPVQVVPWRTKTDLQRAIASLGNVRYVPGMIDGRRATLRLYEQGVARFQRLGDQLYVVGDIDCEETHSH